MPNQALPFKVFISYRREGGEILGRLLYELLKPDYQVFFDHESLSSGRFDTKLLRIIEGCDDVLVILSRGCLDRCKNPGDWFMQEISCALTHGKNIILLITEDFEMPTAELLAELPPEIATLIKYNGHRVSVAYIDSIIAKLHGDMHAPRRGAVKVFDDPENWREFATLLADPAYRERLPNDLLTEILQNAVVASVGEDNGKILNDMIAKSFYKVYNIRTKFRYEIDISKGFDFSVLDVDDDKYYELAESLSWTKRMLVAPFERSFWLSFVTNLDMLDEELKSEAFLFSENLMIEKEELDALIALDDDEKLDFYLHDMRAKLNINGKVLTPTEVRIEESGIFAKYELAEDPSEEVSAKIRFKIPQKKANCFFFSSINDPAYSPFIRFSYPEDELDVTMIPFLSRAITAKDTKVFDGLRELNIENEWVMPVSGAIFIINEQEE